MTELVHLDPEPMQIRSIEERLIEGRIIRFGERIMVRGRPESFAPGAFATVQPEQVRLLRDHDQSKVVGRAVSLEERADGFYGTFKVAKTPAGDELLALAADGMIDALSPGFIPGEQSQDGTHRLVRAMPEVSAVFMGAYPSSRIMAVRSREEETEVDETTEAPEVVETRSVDLSGIETRMDALDAKLDKIESIVDAPVRTMPKGGPTGFDWFMAQMEERLSPRSHEHRDRLDEKWENFQTRAKNGEFLETRELADITGGETGAGDNTPADDLSGLVVEEYIASQLVNILDRRRPLFASFGSFPAPRSGYARIPVVTQHVLVASRTGQKENANSRKMILKTEPFEAKWLDGALDVAIELTQMAELDVMSMVWEDLRGAYAAATEHDDTNGAVPWVEAGGLGFTYTGSALPTDKYENFIGAVEAQVDTVEDATGEPPSLLAVTRTQWRNLVSLVDANDRRLFATIGAQNADASVGLTARSFTLPGGITVFKVKGLTQAMLYSPSALRAADYGPSRVEATNVEKMGRDIGILGRTMLVNRIPGGVVVFGDDPEGS